MCHRVVNPRVLKQQQLHGSPRVGVNNRSGFLSVPGAAEYHYLKLCIDPWKSQRGIARLENQSI